ncbi:MAG: glycosyltransferase, partial [Planctomycetes bacterium]|nr:glycosyltransferase [Planctomycetota bacterium]
SRDAATRNVHTNGDQRLMKRLNILWISHFVPYPPKGGAFQRSYNLIKAVARQHNVYLVAVRHKRETHTASKTEDAAQALGLLCRKVSIVEPAWIRSKSRFYLAALRCLASRHSTTVQFYDFPELHKAIQDVLQNAKINVVHFDAISVAPYVTDVGSLPKVLNHHGAEGFMIERRIARERDPIKKVYFAIEARKLQRDERHYCPQFEVNAVVSEYDEQLLRPAAPNGRFEVIDNGVDLEYFRAPDPGARKDSLIFAGRLDQYSNADGIYWFCSEIWPAIREREPQLKLVIIGRNPASALVELVNGDPRIEITGFVDDVRPYFDRAIAGVVPLRDGGGTRIKVLDAMAMGMPIVATTVACEGLHVEAGKHLLVADTVRDFADATVRLVNDPELRRQLSRSAHEQAERRYSWTAIGERLCRVYSNLVGGSPN